ncbi:hypothetical protein BGK67_17850 [Streptomyces subrutilus]|uniref:Uncharacterized protein n=1 Tax=Streptomyces subrutilus TaxID=36818 RepID=A0A1E5PTS5_9ACTN|nr:hypothetical protein BGK67_17850 [Streptomyces subrutilus]
MWCLLGAVLALLVGCALPAAAAPWAPPPAHGAAAASEGGGPSCAPGPGDHGRPPAVPNRAADPSHAHVPAAGRLSAGRAGDCRAIPVRVLVRGPGQPAPGPVELSVMRV